MEIRIVYFKSIKYPKLFSNKLNADCLIKIIKKISKTQICNKSNSKTAAHARIRIPSYALIYHAII